MSRLYPKKRTQGWMGRAARRNPSATQRNDGFVRVWNTRLEREPLTGTPTVEINPQHAGWVLRDGTYVWGGRGKTRQEP